MDSDERQSDERKRSKESNQFTPQSSKPEVINHNIFNISAKSNIKYLTQKCEELIRKNEKEIILCCTGSALQKGIVLALRLCEQHSYLTNSVKTSTIKRNKLVVPTNDEEEVAANSFYNSAVHIRLTRE